jgi:glycosyltransferase involved in cell wall biosynthesis
MPKVSVVIPVYTRSPYLVEAIKSVINQTYQDFEIIVIDGGLLDKTKEIIKSFKDLRIRYTYRNNISVSTAQNLGFKASRGEYITGVSADDLYLPENLETKVKLLDSRPEIGAVCSDAYIFNPHTGAILSRLWHDVKGTSPDFDPSKAARQPVKEALTKGYFVMVQTAMVRRRVFTEVGYYDDSLPNHEDWEMFIRVAKRYPIELIDTPLVKIRKNRANTFHNADRLYQGAVGSTASAIHSGLLSREECQMLKRKILPQHINYGRRALLFGKKTPARKAFLAAIKIKPANVKLYVYYILSFIGTKNIMKLKNWKDGLLHDSTSHQPSGQKSFARS